VEESFPSREQNPLFMSLTSMRTCKTCAIDYEEKFFLGRGRPRLRKPPVYVDECYFCRRTNTARQQFKRRKEASPHFKAQVYAHYGNKCNCCGEADPAFLTIDHVNNDGAAERKRYGCDTSKFYIRIVSQNYPDRYQILCMNCNWSTRKGGVCPHKRKEAA